MRKQYNILVCVLVLLLDTTSMIALGQRINTNTEIFNPNFKTLQVHLNGNEFFPPIINLGTTDRLTFSFDELNTEMQYMRYRLLHCNADWQPSDLVESEYLDGFNYGNIDDYQYSAGTFANYVYYQFSIPNENTQILKSGNYLVQVYPEDNPDDILLQARFYVNENIVNVSNVITSRTDFDYNREHQQVSVKVAAKNSDIRNWYNDMKLFVSQNSRLDNEVMLTRPNLIESNSIKFEHNRDLIFPAGNEFRRFEVVATNYPGMHVESIQHHNPYYHVSLFTDEVRQNQPYTYDQTQFGRFKIRQSGVNDYNSNADYVIVHFTLDQSQINNGDIYVEGDFTNHLFNQDTKMHYNQSTGKYEKELMLKMGSYNYQYLFKPNGSATAIAAPIEGNHYQTVNEYLSRVYYRAPGDRYDRMVGFAIGYSGR